MHCCNRRDGGVARLRTPCSALQYAACVLRSASGSGPRLVHKAAITTRLERLADHARETK